MNALIVRKNRFPFLLSRESFKARQDAVYRLMTPERHAWWFNMGKADGQRGYGCNGPNTAGSRRLYRLGWLVGRKDRERPKLVRRPCCQSHYNYNVGVDKCIACGTVLSSYRTEHGRRLKAWKRV